MAKQQETQAEETANPLKGTFFDTFEFNSISTETPKKREEETEEEKLARLEADEAAAKVDPPKKKEEEPEKKEEETSPEEIQEQIEATATALKDKKEEELDEDEKQFLADYEAGTLKDYTPQTEPKKEEETSKEEGFDTLTKSLVKEGILAELPDEDIEDSQDSFKKAINRTVEAKVDEWVEKIPEEYRNVIDHFQNGGDINSYVQSRQTINYDNLDYKSEQVQEALVRADLERQGYAKEDIDEKIQDLKDLEKIEKEAVRAGKVFSKEQEDRIAEANAKIEEAREAREAAEEKEIEDISETIDKMDDIAGFKLTDKRREAFKDFLFKVDDNGETAASRLSQSMEDRIKMYFMGFVNYDFKDLQKQVESKKSRDLSKLLSRYTNKNTQSSGTTVGEKPPAEEQEFELKIPSMFGGGSSD